METVPALATANEGTVSGLAWNRATLSRTCWYCKSVNVLVVLTVSSRKARWVAQPLRVERSPMNSTARPITVSDGQRKGGDSGRRLAVAVSVVSVFPLGILTRLLAPRG